MLSEFDIQDKLRKIQALYEKASSVGEKEAAEAAKKRLTNATGTTPTPPLAQEQIRSHRCCLGDTWTVSLFIALARKHGLRVYRRYRQHRTTVMVDTTHSFLHKVLWPEFTALSVALNGYLNEATNRIIQEAVHHDTSDAPICGELYDQEVG
jgi:hypothetical protein